MAFLFLFFIVALSLCVVGLIVLALAVILGSVRGERPSKKLERERPLRLLIGTSWSEARRRQGRAARERVQEMGPSCARISENYPHQPLSRNRDSAALRADTLWRNRTLIFLSRQMLQRRYGLVHEPRGRRQRS
jgi:hypothetical protein